MKSNRSNLISIALAISLLVSALSVRAQQDIISKGIKVNEKVPETLITGINNYKVKQAYLSSFKGKLLILDFWATWCSPCRAMMPVMDSLQRVFKDSVVFLPIAYESSDKVAPVLAQIKKSHQYNLPGVTGDKVLNQMFPHQYLPHYVWVDTKGVVCAITEEDQVNAANIRAILNGKQTAMEEKKDIVIAYSKEVPLLVGGNGGSDTNTRYRSLITGYMPGLPGGMDIFPGNSVKGERVLLRNSPMSWLFLLAYYDKGWFTGPRVKLLSADSGKMTTRLSGQAFTKWLAGNGLCYELMIPPSLNDSTFALVRDDLRRLYPHYQVGIERQHTRCRVLVRTAASDKLHSAGGASTFDISPFSCEIRNYRLNLLISRLETQFMQNSPYPIIDETGYNGRVDLSLHASLSNVIELNKELEKYDLKFEDKDAWTDILVVRDTGRSH